MSEHSDYGASCASRWRTCPGSVAFIRAAKAAGDIPGDNSSAAADEGTLAHQWAEKALDADDVGVLEGMRDAEMERHLIGYFQLCQSFITRGCTYFIEDKVPLWYRPEDSGTVDFASVSDDSIVVIDLKYGSGVHVPAEDNSQLAIYTWSLLRAHGYTMPGDTPVRMCIYQPRHRDAPEGGDWWETTYDDLGDFCVDIEADYEIAVHGDYQMLVASETACRFCPVKGICAERAKTSFGGMPPAVNAMEEFEDETAPVITAKNFTMGMLTPGQVKTICERGPEVIKIIKQVIEGETLRLEAGGERRGMKLVQGRGGQRKYVDEDRAETFLRRNVGATKIFEKKMLSAAKACDLIESEPRSPQFMSRWNKMVTKTVCRPQLVPEGDPRPALEIEPAEKEFEPEVPEGAAALL